MKCSLDYQEDDEFPIDSKTNEFFVSIFVDLPYDKEEGIINLLKNEMNLECLRYYDARFNLNDSCYLDHGVCCGGGRFQQKITLPFVFNDRKEAFNWINEKIKNSAGLSFFDFSESYFSLIDIKPFIEDYNKGFDIYNAEKDMKEKILYTVALEENVFYQNLSIKLNKIFKEPEIINEILKNKIKN